METPTLIPDTSPTPNPDPVAVVAAAFQEAARPLCRLGRDLGLADLTTELLITGAAGGALEDLRPAGLPVHPRALSDIGDLTEVFCSFALGWMAAALDQPVTGPGGWTIAEREAVTDAVGQAIEGELGA